MSRRGRLLVAAAGTFAASVAELPDGPPGAPLGPGRVAASPASAEEVRFGDRDPFRPPVPARNASPTAPLQSCELDELAVVATISGPALSRAVLEDAAGTGFVVSVGTAVGRRGGVVETISPLRVVVAEPSLEGGLAPRTVRVVLRTRERSPAPDVRRKPAGEGR